MQSGLTQSLSEFYTFCEYGLTQSHCSRYRRASAAAGALDIYTGANTAGETPTTGVCCVGR